jgi:hypothetical protein
MHARERPSTLIATLLHLHTADAKTHLHAFTSVSASNTSISAMHLARKQITLASFSMYNVGHSHAHAFTQTGALIHAAV